MTNGKWIVRAEYADGEILEAQFNCNERTYSEEQERQYRLEAWAVGWHPGCIYYDVAFEYDDEYEY